jgi:hypothetical protein
MLIYHHGFLIRFDRNHSKHSPIQERRCSQKAQRYYDTSEKTKESSTTKTGTKKEVNCLFLIHQKTDRMPLKSIKTLNMTSKLPAHKLRGTLPTGYHILSKQQTKKYKEKKAALRKKGNKKPNVGVQLHRNEMVLDLPEKIAYKAIMKSRV